MSVIKKIEKPKVAISNEAIIMGADKRAHGEYVKKANLALQDESYWRLIKQLRDDPGKGWSKDRLMRKVAHIPVELYEAARRAYGPEIFKDKKLFKKYFAEDEIGQWTLTVPKDTL